MKTPYEYQYMSGEIVGDNGCVYRGHTQPSYALFMCPLCGKEFETRFVKVLNGYTTSCGCYGIEARRLATTKHGLSNHPVYFTWHNIKARCYNPKDTNYPYYGGRGIIMHQEWKDDFKAFYDYVIQLSDYGKEGYTLDREKVDGNYEPNNIRWADRHIQAVNQGMRFDNTSGYTGVYPKGNRWQAKLHAFGEENYIGSFITIEEALDARNQYILDNKLVEYKIQEIH